VDRSPVGWYLLMADAYPAIDYLLAVACCWFNLDLARLQRTATMIIADWSV
jgi:hypothetical protein